MLIVLFFSVGHFEFFFRKKKKIFLLHSHENQLKFIWQNGWVKILTFSLVSRKFLGVRNIVLYSVCELQVSLPLHFHLPLPLFFNDEKMCTLQLGGAQRVVLSMESSHTLHVKVVLGSFGSDPLAQQANHTMCFHEFLLQVEIHLKRHLKNKEDQGSF